MNEYLTRPRICKPVLYGLLASIVLFYIGAYYVVDHIQEKRAMATTKCVSYIINKDYVSKLTCSSNDIGTYGYERLKTQLGSLSKINNGRYTCILVKDNNDIKFAVDSEPVGTLLYGAPGDLYDDIPEHIRNVFNTKKDTRVGPYTDKWGSWVSMIVPLRFDNDKLVVLLENDIEAHEWIINNIYATILPITIYSLFIVLVLFLIKSKKINKELVVAKRIADTANEAKSNFLANMSHEIRTPLNGIVGAVQLLTTTDVSEEQKRYTDMALSCSESLLNLINDILDYSKLEARKIIINNKVFDLIDVIDQTLDMERVIAKEKNIEIKYQSKMLLPVLIGDAPRLKQILSNLFNNAVKFSNNNSIIIFSSSIENETIDKMTIKFSITDHGIGIDEENIPKLFNRFYQVQTGLTRNYSGAGLGLSICKQLIDLMGGEIGVITKKNFGSTFWFTITFDKPTNEDVQKQDGIVLRTTKQEEIKILLVEDVPMNRKIIEAMLQKNNYNTNSVDNGKRAVDELMKNKYTMVLMDMQMPIMDGLDATRIIRQGDGPNKHTPIIALTANAIGDVKDVCLDVGMNDYLSKPVTLPALLATIEKWENINGPTQTNI